MSTTTVARRPSGRVRRQSWKAHPEAWANGPVKGAVKCRDYSEKHDDVCQLRIGHTARHFGAAGGRWNHTRVAAR